MNTYEKTGEGVPSGIAHLMPYGNAAPPPLLTYPLTLTKMNSRPLAVFATNAKR